MIRLAHFVTHPIQYFAPLYQELARTEGLDLTVFFGSAHGVQPSFDAGFNQHVQFDVPLLSGYTHRFLPNRGSGAPTGQFRNFDTPELQPVLAEGHFQALWVHGWGYQAQWQALRAARRLRIPFLVRSETNVWTRPANLLRRLARRFLVGRMLRAAAACLYVGQSNREFLQGMGVPEGRLSPAHYSVDAERFRDAAGDPESRAHTRRFWGAEPGTFVVVAAAKAIARKRLPDAIQAVARLGPAVHLWILGDGPERGPWQTLSGRVAPKQVRWHGFVNQAQMPRVLAGADALVLPSEDEPWGLAVNEAMACGLPAIASDRVGCAPDLIRAGVTGYTYPVGDVGALAERLGRLQANPEAARQMGRAAQDLVLREYDVKTTARQIAAATRAVLAERASQRCPELRRNGVSSRA